MTTIEHADTDGVDAPSDAIRTAARLDEHHAPETNGWMAVCRRCGMQTDGPQGQHLPSERQLVRANAWLDGQAMNLRIARLTSGRNS